MIDEMLRGCWAFHIEPNRETKPPFVADAIIANPPSVAHVHCARALEIPVRIMFTMPWNATRAFPDPLVKSTSITDIEFGTANRHDLIWPGRAHDWARVSLIFFRPPGQTNDRTMVTTELTPQAHATQPWRCNQPLEETAARIGYAVRFYGALHYNIPAYTAHALLVPRSDPQTGGLGLGDW
jgi:hypothetical protein